MSESGDERGRGEWRVGERRSGMQQQGGQLMDDIGERGEGECGINGMATRRRRQR